MKILPLKCMLAAAFAVAWTAQAEEREVIEEPGRVVNEERQPYRPEPAEDRVPRDPGEFVFGQYHRSSKMEPKGSLEPESWAETDAVELPEGARPTPTISEAAEMEEIETESSGDGQPETAASGESLTEGEGGKAMRTERQGGEE